MTGLLAAAMVAGSTGAMTGGAAASQLEPREPAEASMLEAWRASAQTDEVAREALRDFAALGDGDQSRLLEIIDDPDIWVDAFGALDGDLAEGVHEIAPEVELVVEESTARQAAPSTDVVRPYGAPEASVASVEGGATLDAAARRYNVTTTSTIAFRVFGVRIGHWRQVYRYVTRHGQYAIVSSRSCDGWFSGFSGFWNVSESTRHYKSGSFGYCLTRYKGGLVFKGAVISVNKEHGQKVAGPRRVSKWLRNV